MMSKAKNIQDILCGEPLIPGKKLYAHVECPCCGRVWFEPAERGVYSIEEVPIEDENGNVADFEYVGCVTCDNCNYTVSNCSLVSSETLYKRFSDYKEE